MTRAPWYPLTVFYDGSCTLCASEMRALERRDDDGHLTLVDCSAADFDDSVLAGTGITRADLMVRIHVRDAHGRWLAGPEALAAAYGAVGDKRAARVWGSRRLRPLLDAFYRGVARHRQVLSRFIHR